MRPSVEPQAPLRSSDLNGAVYLRSACARSRTSEYTLRTFSVATAVTSAADTGHRGASAVPRRAHAAWRAAPRATYSPGSGTLTGTPSSPGAIARTAGEAAAP